MEKSHETERECVMKKVLSLLILLLLVNFVSCEYDKTQAIQELFSPEHCHKAVLCFDETRHEIVLSIYEDKVFSLRFTDGALKGLEKIFEGQTERHRLEETEFTLPAPSDYALICEAVDDLSRRHYVHQAPEEGASSLSFSFTDGDAEYTLQTDLSASALKHLKIVTPRHRITLEFITTHEAAYVTP